VSAPDRREYAFALDPETKWPESITLAPLGRAFLTVTVSDPSVHWANVKVDGRPRGRTPLVNHELSEGNHRVVVECPAEVCGEKRVWSRKVELAADERHTVEFE
jgi:hypothetical protein